MQYYEFSKKSNEEIFKELETSEEGISNSEANKRLQRNGINVATDVKKKGPFYFILQSFKDKFILILLVLAVIDYITSDVLGTIIIVCLAVASAMLRFVQDYSTYRFNEKLKARIRPKTNVIRKNNEQSQEIYQERVALGDIITLSAGSVVPADLILIESKDLFLNQSVFTGESVPVEKVCGKAGEKGEDAFLIPNICLMGTSVVSGNGKGVVIATGLNTYMGQMNKDIDKKREPTNFEKGMTRITNMLIRYMVVISIAVFAIYGFIRKDLTEALLFALSVAVGITPSMLPMIVNVNLTRGSKNLAKKKTLVKNIQSIQNIGSMDILCTDKTGTLTMNNIVLQKYINAEGNDDENILKAAYLNSSLGTGLKNLVDRAVIAYGKSHKVDISNYKKVDEIPFDYMRKRMSIVVKSDDYLMITKGALEEILKICDTALINGEKVKLTDEIIESVNGKAEAFARSGMQVISLAVKNKYDGVGKFNVDDEENMCLIGLIAFLDPPKKDAKDTIKKLKKVGVTTKILTGDNPYATENICSVVGINSKILIGKDIDKMNDKKLAKVVEEVDVFARMNPMQKERVVKALKANGHVVGYMGDGVNDAPSLHASDVGISVEKGTDIAKETSDIILLDASLEVIYNGVIEGRKVYGNIIKYMKLALSSDFGDVFSVMIASVFLPFLPLLPIQMLMQDFIFEFSQIGIPYDNVDEEFIQKARKWDTKDLGKFMNIMGIISSITDVLAFLIFWFIFGYNSIEKQAYFQTAWFIECIVSETMVIYYIRTDRIPFFKSKPSKALVSLTIITIALTIITPLALHGLPDFNFMIMPIRYYLYLILLVVLYALIVQVVKKEYIKKNGEWL